ncbi:MAG: thiamine pyrophosphate-dependent enzyme [Candidatus Margulisbacteria bacterium]|jgi:2-oxoglutarate ferredoxin oxidoreductase subunit beta|nr:thiamine pyrophosphate-dependent enzyme [Candidatus Margulisiibacteriota bacterium]
MVKETAWCPGCGNFAILGALQKALAELEIAPQKLVIASGIGQAAKTPHYLPCNFFNGLHGRALPPATAIKAANPELTVIAESGDGDMYGEGGNHFIQTIRRNPDIINIVHNNMVYGLTKGQASPTSQYGMKTPIQVGGVFEEPFNPIVIAVALDAPFVARANAADIEQTKEIIKQAIRHPGYSLIDIFQPCISFNKINTFAWFKEHTYYLDAGYDPRDRQAALAKGLEIDRFPLGVIYRQENRESFNSHHKLTAPLFQSKPDPAKLAALIDSKL